MNSGAKNKIRITVEELSNAVYEIALGVAAKMQQDLLEQQSLEKYKEQIDSSTLGFITSSLWLVNQIGQKIISRRDFRDRFNKALIGKYYEYLVNASGGQIDRKELQDYLTQLHAIYDSAWADNREPGRTWWVAAAMAKEVLNEQNAPELGVVIMVGEVESTLAIGARLARQYILY
jgi:hypothetical protein